MGFKDFFIETMDWYKKQGVDVFIHGSTLLNIIRRDTVTPRRGVGTDKEINIGILAEDLTDELLENLEKDYGFFLPIEGKIEKCGYYYATKATKKTVWDIRPGFVFLTVLHKAKTTRFKHHGQNYCIMVPNEYVDNKSEWAEVEVHGGKYKAPAHLDEYLDGYYGDWRTENKKWHWSESGNFITWEDLQSRGEI